MVNSRKNLLSDIPTEFACLSVPFYCDRAQKETWGWAGTLPLNVSVPFALWLSHKTVLSAVPSVKQSTEVLAPQVRLRGRTAGGHHAQLKWVRASGSGESTGSRDPMVRWTSCAI